MCDTTDNGDGGDDDEDIFFNDCESIESITLSEIDGDHMDDEFDLKTPFSLEYQFYEWLEQFDNNEDTEIEFSAEIYDWDLDFNEDMDVEHHTIEFSAELYEWDFNDFEDNKEDLEVKRFTFLLKKVQMRPFLQCFKKWRSYSVNMEIFTHKKDGKKTYTEHSAKLKELFGSEVKIFDPGIFKDNWIHLNG